VTQVFKVFGRRIPICPFRPTLLLTPLPSSAMLRKRAPPPIGIHVKDEGEGDRYGIAVGDDGWFMMQMVMMMML
jgi:hypothetical protein